MSQLSSLSAGFQSQVTSLQTQSGDTRTEARRGIAASVALGIAMTPSAPGRTTVSLNSGFYQGEGGVGIAVAHRLNFAWPVIIHGGWARTRQFGGTGEELFVPPPCAEIFFEVDLVALKEAPNPSSTVESPAARPEGTSGLCREPRGSDGGIQSGIGHPTAIKSHLLSLS